MRIVEIRIPSDVAVFKKRLYPAALFPVPTPPVISFLFLKKYRREIVEEEFAYAIKRNFPVPLIPTVPRILGAGSVIGQGIFTGISTLFNFAACSLDSVVTLYLVPRCEVPQVLMPIAYITQVNMPTDNVGCTGTSTTIPATGANQALVEGNNVPPINQ